MYFNIKRMGKLPGPTKEFERSLVFETGEFERPKFDCSWVDVGGKGLLYLSITKFYICCGPLNDDQVLTLKAPRKKASEK